MEVELVFAVFAEVQSPSLIVLDTCAVLARVLTTSENTFNSVPSGSDVEHCLRKRLCRA
jgi:hypothetical protein